MLHAAPHLRLLTVPLFLFLRQRMASRAFLAYYRSYVFRPPHILHPGISRVEPRRSPIGFLGRLCQYAQRLIGVVAIGCTHRVVPYELGLFANLHIVLVSAEPLATLLYPSGIYVLIFDDGAGAAPQGRIYGEGLVGRDICACGTYRSGGCGEEVVGGVGSQWWLLAWGGVRACLSEVIVTALRLTACTVFLRDVAKSRQSSNKFGSALDFRNVIKGLTSSK